ncbi:hypothetical protein N7470_007576 [Penicillium chermesinum]|nr:hypothetical protein N7470_007576 [Penicillium chermesinum]
MGLTYVGASDVFLDEGVAGCSNESTNSVSGDVVSRRLSSFEIRSKLCVLLWDKLTATIVVWFGGQSVEVEVG